MIARRATAAAKLSRGPGVPRARAPLRTFQPKISDAAPAPPSLPSRTFQNVPSVPYKYQHTAQHVSRQSTNRRTRLPAASQVLPFLIKTFELVECRDPCLHRSHMWYNSSLRRLVHTFRQNVSLPFIWQWFMNFNPK